MIDQGRLIAQIVLGVCELRNCQANSILAPRRHKEAMYNRMLVYLIAHDYCQLSYSGIARVLNQDHTTVIHGVKRAIGEYETNADFRKDYIQLTQEVRLWMEQQLSTTSTSPSNSFHSHVLQKDGHNINVPENMSRALIRPDTHDVLGVHGSKYRITTHSQVVDTVEEAVVKANLSSDRTMNVDVYENGALLKGTISFNDITIEPVVGDYIRFDINFWNSYNGQWSIQISGDGRRLFCMNGCTTPTLLHAPSANTVPTSTQNKKPPSSHAHWISSSIKKMSGAWSNCSCSWMMSRLVS